MLLHIVGQRVAIELLGALVGEVGQIVGLKLDAVYLVVAAVLVGGELVEELLLGEAVAPLFLGAKVFGDGEEGHDGAVVDAVYLDLVEYLGGVGKCLGHIAEDVVHLLAGLKPLLLGVAHAVGVVQVLTRRDTEQMVVGFGGLLVLKVAVVGADELDAILAGHLDEHLVGLLLQGEGFAVGQNGGVGHLVALELEVIVVAKHAMIPLTRLAGSLDVAMQNLGGYLAGDTCRADDEVFVVALEVGAVGTRTIVVAICPRIGDELDEILVTIIVLGQHDEVVTAVVAHLLDLVFLAAARHIHLTTQDGLERLEPLLLALLVDTGAVVGQFLDAIHHAVVGDRHTAHAVGNGLVDQVGYLGLTVEYRVVGVYVQVYKIFHVGGENCVWSFKVTYICRHPQKKRSQYLRHHIN